MATYDLGNSEFGLSHMPGSPGNSAFGLSHNHADDIQLSAANPDPSVRDFVLNSLFNEDNSASPVSGPQDVPVATGIGDNFTDTQNAPDNMVLTGQDTLFDDAGNDTIPAADGNDSILGGGGDEQLDEQLFDGEAGNDTIFGGDGDRQLLSGGADTLLGAESADTLFGGAGANDTLSGGDGADQTAVDTGEDQLTGTAGNDTILAGDGSNTLFGGGGDDTFEINNHVGDSTIVGGGGHNTVEFNDRASTDVDSMDTAAGTTTITFTDGQTTTTSDVQDLVFTDGAQHLP